MIVCCEHARMMWNLLKDQISVLLFLSSRSSSWPYNSELLCNAKEGKGIRSLNAKQEKTNAMYVRLGLGLVYAKTL